MISTNGFITLILVPRPIL